MDHKSLNLHAILYTRWKRQTVDEASWIGIMQDACQEYVRHLTPSPSSTHVLYVKEPSESLAAWMDGLLQLNSETLHREQNIVTALKQIIRDDDCLVIKPSAREFALMQLNTNGLELVRFVLDQISGVLFQPRTDPIPFKSETSQTVKRKSKSIEMIASYIKTQVEKLRKKRPIDKWPLVLYPIFFLIEHTNNLHPSAIKVEMGLRTLTHLLPLFPDTQGAAHIAPIVKMARLLLESVWGKYASSPEASPKLCCLLM